jgi:serine/threonine protein kinase
LPRFAIWERQVTSVARVLAGRYELEALIGRGGFGEVWRGRDKATREPVAVKLVELAGVEDAGQLAETITRFRREAATLASLAHPNIVASRDAGRVGTELFLVLDLVEGASLDSVREQRAATGRGELPVSSALRIVQQVCAGLAAAHAAGIVHRDIKPGNLILGPQLRVTLVDFGIARLLDDSAPRLTRPGTAVGTLAYAAPEQLAGVHRGGHDDVDGRTDLYSLGCVLYELLAGRRPFTAQLPEALLRMQLLEQAVPLDSVRAGLPAEVPVLVADLMAKERSARPTSAVTAGERIAAILAKMENAETASAAERVTVWPRVGATVAAGPGREMGPPPEWLDELSDPEPGLDGHGLAAEDPHRPDTAGARRTRTVRPVNWRPAEVAPRGRGRTSEKKEKERKRFSGRRNTAPRPGRRHPRWRGAVSTLVTAAIVGGGAAYAWHKTHQSLAVTGVSVAVANQPGTRCDVTVTLVGTIVTNGHGGPVTYQWIRDSTDVLPAQTATAATGSDTLQVSLNWQFNGPGTKQAVAELHVLAPTVGTASAAFTYSCAR